MNRGVDESRLFTENLGGGAFMQRLRMKGWENSQITVEVARIIEEEMVEVDKFAGHQLPEEHEPMYMALTFHTALRLLCEREDVMRYALVGFTEEGAVNRSQTGPVTYEGGAPVEYEADDYGDEDFYDDLEGEGL